MTAFRIAPPAVADAFPDTLIALVTATGLRGREPWPDTTAALEELEQQLADGTWQPADETDPRIEAWHTACRSFGTNPRRIRPSVDALGRRMVKKGTLPRINPAVDSYNAVSARHGLPADAAACPDPHRPRPAPEHRPPARGRPSATGYCPVKAARALHRGVPHPDSHSL